MGNEEPGGFARATCMGKVAEQYLCTYCESTREQLARGDLIVGGTKIPVVAKGQLAKEISAVRPGDLITITGKIVSYDVSKMKHRGGVPYLEIQITEIVEWQKVPKTC